MDIKRVRVEGETQAGPRPVALITRALSAISSRILAPTVVRGRNLIPDPPPNQVAVSSSSHLKGTVNNHFSVSNSRVGDGNGNDESKGNRGGSRGGSRGDIINDFVKVKTNDDKIINSESHKSLKNQFNITNTSESHINPKDNETFKTALRRNSRKMTHKPIKFQKNEISVKFNADTNLCAKHEKQRKSKFDKNALILKKVDSNENIELLKAQKRLALFHKKNGNLFYKYFYYKIKI